MTDNEVLLISLIALELSHALDSLPACKDETVLKGDGKPKMVFHTSCRRLKRHTQKHSDGCSEWE
jgi:hypothetical protein